MAGLNSSNKKLAKNTLFLYFRMLFLMIVTLYTSRVTLQVLGVDDFGIYNIVSGVVVLFSFLSRSMSGTCTRFLSVALKTGDEDEVQKVFSNALVSHIGLAGVVLLLLETFGLWLVVKTLNIPADRYIAALFIYQVAIVQVCFCVVRVPYQSSIVANEHMNFYAYSSIVEGVLRLLVVFGLWVIPFDKLIGYSLLLLGTTVCINIWYMWYCRNKLSGNRSVFKVEKTNLKDMITFSGWNMVGGVSDVAWQQGTNIILNMFYGVGLNAVMGITNQIRNAVYSFVTNLQVAAQPQIIKSYAGKEYSHFYSLVFATSKYSYYLMLLIAIPLIQNIDFVLSLWLKNPPEYASLFTSLILIFCIFDSLNGPLWTANQATGDVRAYNIWTSWLLLLNIPVVYILFKMDYPPESMLYARIILMLLNMVCQLVMTKIKTNMGIMEYFKSVIFPIVIVGCITTASSTYIVSQYTDWTKLVLSVFINTFILVVSVAIFGMNRNEKNIVVRFIRHKFQKRI